MHALFDKGWIILVPEGDIVQKYVDGGIPDFDGDVRDSVSFV